MEETDGGLPYTHVLTYPLTTISQTVVDDTFMTLGSCARLDPVRCLIESHDSPLDHISRNGWVAEHHQHSIPISEV